MTTSTVDDLAALRELARRHGIAPSYQDTRERRVEVSGDVLLAVLRSLDVPITRPRDAGALLGADAQETTALPPVIVAAADRATTRRLANGRAGRWDLVTDDGADVASGGVQDATIELPPLPVGFFELRFERDDRSVEHARVFSAPPVAYVDPALGRSWGLFVPLHAVPHADHAGHLGDIHDLARMMRPIGGRVVAVLPLLATFLGADPYDHSPYQPVSRRFGSELYIDPDRLPHGMPAPTGLPPAPPTTEGLIDPRALQRRADALVDHVRSELWTNSPAAADLDRYRRSNPAVSDYADFRAAIERHGPGGAHLTGDPSVVEHHVISQWLLDAQLHQLRDELDQHGQALALDLPVGSHPDGYDVVRHRDQYAEAAVGAPPDDFFASGQNWGFPPLHPVASRRRGHRVFTDAVDALARHAGILRIDHILGLHRLWWVPPGFSAADGAYVHYPLDELLAAVCIISHLRRTVVVGEDLGTVPPEVTVALHRHGILGMHEEQFVIGDPPTDRLPTIDRATVAGVRTHDMPPFAGFWDGTDLELQVELGQSDATAVAAERSRRSESIDAYRRLVARALGHEVAEGPTATYTAAVERLARSDADQVMLDVEDLWGEHRPQNVPGTSTEVPNWRRRLAHDLDAAFTGEPGRILELVAAQRRRDQAPDRDPGGSS